MWIFEVWTILNSALSFEMDFLGEWSKAGIYLGLLKLINDGEYIQNEEERLSQLV